MLLRQPPFFIGATTTVINTFMANSVVIESGESLSSAPTTKNSIIGLQFGAAWTGTTITFLGSADGVTYGPVYDALGAELELTLPGSFVANMVVAFGNDLIAPLSKLRYLKFQSGTTSVPVVQAADRTILLLTAII